MASQKSDSYYRLTAEDQISIGALRSKVKDYLHPRYDTDFNLYRWVKHAEKTKPKQIDTIDFASKTLINHLRYRKSLNLNDRVVSWDENPLFTDGGSPRGHLHYMPSNNRYLWYVDYSQIDVEGTLYNCASRDLMVWHLWKYELLLKLVNDKEKETGALSGVCMIMDVKYLRITPGFMISTNNGHMSYTAHLLYYEQYPELVYPINIVNVSRLLMLPLRIVQLFMPHDFTDRFRIYDSNFRSHLLEQMTDDDLPKQLGGRNPRSDQMATRHPKQFGPDDSYEQRISRREVEPPPDSDRVYRFQVPKRKRQVLSIFCSKGSTLKWWSKADGEIYFGIYFSDDEIDWKNQKGKIDVFDNLEMVHAKLMTLPKYVPEIGALKCQKTGAYHFCFCNKGSWFYQRKVEAYVEVDGKSTKEFDEVLM